MLIRKATQAGDTIVEVMLCIAIIGGVLAGAFVANNRNVRINAAAQERGEALKVTESQIEKLKSAKITAAPGINLLSGGPYCIDDTGHQLTVASSQISNSPNCTFSNRYVSTVTYSGNQYRIVTLWPNITGDTTSLDGTTYPGYDKLVMYYRID